MDTPICDFVKEYNNKKALRLHMPGHKGNTVIGNEPFDITEIDGADVLYQSSGIIEKSQQNAASLFCSKKTLYSTEGSSLSIRAMLYLVSLYAKTQSRRPVIACGRNAHKTFVGACALLDIEVDWLYGDDFDNILCCNITAKYLETYLTKHKLLPVAVYITSPDYLGNMADIKGIADVCHKHNVLLLVDNAHGAYLNFLNTSLHPMTLGADMCCDSAHKTLPVLTGGAYLHISKTAPELFCQSAETAMKLFASTSPSYLILQSLDKANDYLEKLKPGLDDFVKKTNQLTDSLKNYGFDIVGDEPLKITISSKSFGYYGTELAKILYENGIICEFYDPDFVVLMLSEVLKDQDLEKIKKVLLSVPVKEKILQSPPAIPVGERVMTLKETLFYPFEIVDIDNALGRVLASPSVSCPPAVPILMSGEMIKKTAINCFKYYGIERISVIK